MSVKSVSSLWVGGPLGMIQKISLSSFIYHGYNVNLYVYDMNMDVPKGVIKKDANNILPEKTIFLNEGQLAAFSDIFRYAMIYMTGETWVDADTICLNDSFLDTREYAFIEESSGYFAGGILKMPQNSGMAKSILKDALERRHNAVTTDWCYLGPTLVTKWVKHFGLQNHAIPNNMVSFFPNSHESIKLWDKEFTDQILKESSEAYCMTPFNGGLTKNGFAHLKNTMPDGSAIKYFYDKFLV